MAAKNHENFLQLCRSLKSINQNLEDVRLKLQEIVESHYAVPYDDVASQDGTGWLKLDADGQIQGVNFTANTYINAIVMAEQINNFFTNVAVAQGDYKTTLQLTIQPERT